MVRLKSRYLLAEITFEDGLIDESLTSTTVYHDIMSSVQKTHGDFGTACVKMSFKVKYINPYTGIVKIKCSRDYYRMLWQAITFVNEINGRRCYLRTIHLAGTINSCQKYLIKHNKEQLVKMLGQCKTPAEKQKLTKVLEQLQSTESRLTPSEVQKRKQTKLAWKHWEG